MKYAHTSYPVSGVHHDGLEDVHAVIFREEYSVARVLVEDLILGCRLRERRPVRVQAAHIVLDTHTHNTHTQL